MLPSRKPTEWVEIETLMSLMHPCATCHAPPGQECVFTSSRVHQPGTPRVGYATSHRARQDPAQRILHERALTERQQQVTCG
jgi:hypothetical protein